MRRIAIIQGHPDPAGNHFDHALADAYAVGAQSAGHAVQRVEIASLDFPLLRTKDDWEKGPPVAAIREAQDTIRWADHLVFIYPLWIGEMPALLKAFLEQILRPGFAVETGNMRRKLLKGRSARIVVTMGMPALLYRWYFRGRSVKSLAHTLAVFTGIGPIETSMIGLIESGTTRRERWLERMTALGRAGR